MGWIENSKKGERDRMSSPVGTMYGKCVRRHCFHRVYQCVCACVTLSLFKQYLLMDSLMAHSDCVNNIWMFLHESFEFSDIFTFVLHFEVWNMNSFTVGREKKIATRVTIMSWVKKIFCWYSLCDSFWTCQFVYVSVCVCVHNVHQMSKWKVGVKRIRMR